MNSGIAECEYCGLYYSESRYISCPRGCKMTTVNFQTYGFVTSATSLDRTIERYGEEDMCEKTELTTKWNLRISYDGNKKYAVEFKKRVADDNRGYTVSVDDIVRTFDTFEEALKYTNEVYKTLSK